MLTGRSVKESFDLSGRVAIITGGAGLLGIKHGEAIAEMGGTPVLLDIDGPAAEMQAAKLSETYGVDALGLGVDITVREDLERARQHIIDQCGGIHILINNAANNPKMENRNDKNFSRLENFPLEIWNQDIAVGLSGAFLCAQVFGTHMAENSQGVILNVASDLGLIGPDQRLYRQDSVAEDKQPVKPVTYSVVKSGLIGLTRYLATYWADRGVRANAIAPGGVYTDQDDVFVHRLTNLIPLGRMADRDEYKAAVAFMVSDASSYMTGSVLAIDGGRSCW